LFHAARASHRRAAEVDSERRRFDRVPATFHVFDPNRQHVRRVFPRRWQNGDSPMTSKTLIVALAMLLTATSASMAWTHHHTMPHHHGLYNYYGGAYHERGGPGPRVQAGSGMGAGAESGSR
jgi:hypothetical protein